MELEQQWQEIDISERDKVYKIFLELSMDETFGLYKVQQKNHVKFKIIADYAIKWKEFVHKGFNLIWNQERDKIKKVAV